MDDAGAGDTAVQRWDRSRWITVFSSHNPTIREVTECLGLGLSASSSTTNRGIPKFDNPEYRKLSSEVTRLSKELPKEREALLDFAADPRSLDQELEELLATFGPAIWGRDADRACLLTPDSSKKTYFKDLYYDEPGDKEMLKTHLHRWIIIKACYYIRNMKLKRTSVHGDYETVAEFETEAIAASPAMSQLMSPRALPQSTTPPVVSSTPTAGTEKTSNDLKRKSSVYMSVSENEEHAAPVKRPYQSLTVPTQRKSPRKSLKSLAMASPSTENIPPVPKQSNQLPPPAGSGAVHETARPLLSPLSSNDLNGTARPISTSPSTFTAVNIVPNIFPNPPNLPNPPSIRNYSSPYAPPSAPQNVPSPHNRPSVDTTPNVSNGFHAINSPIVPNGCSARNSPTIKAMTHANIAPRPPSGSNPPEAHNVHSGQDAPGAPNTQPVLAAQKILKSQPVEIPIDSIPSADSKDTGLLQCELLGSLMQYLFPKPEAKPDEAVLLQTLEQLWSQNAATFRLQMGHLYDVQGKVLHAWIEERRKITQLQRSMENEPGVPAPVMVDRLLAMNDLRVLRLKWKAMNTQDGSQRLSPEDLLCRDFAAMTNTEGTEYLFKDGLDKLNESIFEFLRSEDMKILMTKR